MLNKLVAHGRGRCLVTCTDAGCGHESDIVGCIFLKFSKQFLATSHHAGQRCADPDRASGWRRFTFTNEVEMVIEACDFPDFGHWKTHPVGEGGKMVRCRTPLEPLPLSLSRSDPMPRVARMRPAGGSPHPPTRRSRAAASAVLMSARRVSVRQVWRPPPPPPPP